MTQQTIDEPQELADQLGIDFVNNNQKPRENIFEDHDLDVILTEASPA